MRWGGYGGGGDGGGGDGGGGCGGGEDMQDAFFMVGAGGIHGPMVPPMAT